MKNKRFLKIILFLICLLLIILGTILFSSSQEPEDQDTDIDIEKIEYGEVYTFHVGDDSPPYIKFLDEKKYVAITNKKNPENSFADGESYSINFIEGEYQNLKDNFYLGKVVKTVAIFFDDDEELSKKEYNRFYKRDKAGKNTFETGMITEKKDHWVYERTVNGKLVEYPLKKTSRTIQNSIADFLSGYKHVEVEE